MTTVDKLGEDVARLSVEDLARFSEWFKEFTREEERAQARRAVEAVEAFRAEMGRKYGVQPSSVDLIREMRENPRG